MILSASKIKGYCIVLMVLCSTLFSVVNAQEITSQVKGLVQNDRDEPLSGVSVILRNSKTNFTLGTVTDSSGAFTFSRVPSGGPYGFNFSAIGFESQALSGYNIKDDITLSLMVKLKSSNTSLDQVVVVGYGTQNEKT